MGDKSTYRRTIDGQKGWPKKTSNIAIIILITFLMIISIIFLIIIIRNESEPGCVVVCGASQMLPLAKRYFYQSLNKWDSDDDDHHIMMLVIKWW